MDPRFAATREDLYNVQMDVKQLQVTQHSHAEKILRIEKRLAEDAAIRSAWNTPFPSALSGTPQHGPVHISSNDVFDDFDEHGHSLLGSLRLEAEDEPVRRGAASRANSVRFDESALQGSNWNQNTRHSGEFAPIRPSSGFGMMERSLSHKSDGRHSSAGHSVHSVHSVHSAPSGRGSSLGIDTHFIVGAREEDSPLDAPEPPPGFFVMGSVPAIVRCWLIEDFAHNTLLYADVCSGAQRSTLDFSLVKELGLVGDVHKCADGVNRLTLRVYLAEASPLPSSARSPASMHQIPSIAVNFEIVGVDQADSAEAKKAIRIFIGTDALRAHCADLLFSQNLMTLYSGDRDKLSVPFVRPEDDSLFRFLATSNIVPEKPKLNASAPEFVLGDVKAANSTTASPRAQLAKTEPKVETESLSALSPLTLPPEDLAKPADSSASSDSGNESERPPKEMSVNSGVGEENAVPAAVSQSQSIAPATPSENGRKDASAIWGSWRQTASSNGPEGGLRSENGLSGYQPAGRSRMKVLKPSKAAGQNSTRAPASASFEPAPSSSRSSGEHRRKSHGAGVIGGGGVNGSAVVENGSTPMPMTAPLPAASAFGRWDKRSVSATAAPSVPSIPSAATLTGGMMSFGRDVKGQGTPQESRNTASVPRSVNPVGGASAFPWLTPSSSKPKTPAAVGE